MSMLHSRLRLSTGLYYQTRQLRTPRGRLAQKTTYQFSSIQSSMSKAKVYVTRPDVARIGIELLMDEYVLFFLEFFT